MARKNNSNAVNSPSNAIRPVSPEEVYANRRLVMNVAKRLGLDYDSGKDLVQEVAIKCNNNPKIRFNPLKGTLTGYLARIAFNTAVDMTRRNKHLPVPMEDVELAARMEAEVPEMVDEELYRKRGELLERGIREMYRRYPSTEGIDAFVMFWRYGMHAKQVAEKLLVEERFVNVAAHRGLERLKDIVRRLARDENWRNAC